MLTITIGNLRELLASRALEPVLYVARDDDTGKAVGLEVGPEAYVPSHKDILLRQHELIDDLGGPHHPDGETQDALEHLLENYQDTIDMEGIGG